MGEDVPDYERFVRNLFLRLNGGRWQCFAEELIALRPLLERRLDTTRHEHVRVSPGSLVFVHRNTSVHSRLLGEIFEGRLKPDTVEIWYGDREVEELPRLRGRRKHRVRPATWAVRATFRRSTPAPRQRFTRSGWISKGTRSMASHRSSPDPSQGRKSSGAVLRKLQVEFENQR